MKIPTTSRQNVSSRAITGILAALALWLGASAPLHSAPQAELWPLWQAHDAASQTEIDHSAWGQFLSRYLVTNNPGGVNLVRYGSVTASDRALLNGYVALIEGSPVSSLNRDEQFAFWVNLYNAGTVQLILNHYPVASIRDINLSRGLTNRGPWDAKLYTVEGEALSLNDIEHRILRPIWNDARIHYAVNCASIGCPNLHPQPFTAQNHQAVLDQLAGEYINHPRAVTLESGRLQLSSIYNWYAVDFGSSVENIVTHLLEHAEPRLANRLRDHAEAGYPGRVRYEYDWAINAQ